MEIQLAGEQRTVIENLVATGRFPSVEAVVLEGVRLLTANERLRSQVQIGINQADHGDVLDHDTVFEQLKRMALEAESSNG